MGPSYPNEGTDQLKTCDTTRPSGTPDPSSVMEMIFLNGGRQVLRVSERMPVSSIVRRPPAGLSKLATVSTRQPFSVFEDEIRIEAPLSDDFISLDSIKRKV
ncbi:MAG: hypothetical protein AAB250_15555, partial [Bdellovibrionota bacterium]